MKARSHPKASKKSDSYFLRTAILMALDGVEKGNSPFGACIVDSFGEVIAVGHNTVLTKNNPTHHAEINCISHACKRLGSWDLSGCTIYSTTEPCPMCFSAIHWARIKRVVYGTNISDVRNLGFSELSISNKKMKDLGKSKVRITSDFLRPECLELLLFWKSKDSKTY
ncbi:nucleoside deaminase [Candidatus Micrarchaeota archaeon]|nr:nucleoside deaminase [Candidatus Micrarchaeota archaeon]